jgi:hypothetical protein
VLETGMITWPPAHRSEGHAGKARGRGAWMCLSMARRGKKHCKPSVPPVGVPTTYPAFYGVVHHVSCLDCARLVHLRCV